MQGQQQARIHSWYICVDAAVSMHDRNVGGGACLVVAKCSRWACPSVMTGMMVVVVMPVVRTVLQACHNRPSQYTIIDSHCGCARGHCSCSRGHCGCARGHCDCTIDRLQCIHPAPAAAVATFSQEPSARVRGAQARAEGSSVRCQQWAPAALLSKCAASRA